MNSGTLRLKPNNAVYDHMLEIAPILRYNTVFAEQGLLNAYWAQAITFLPYVYNGQLGIKRVFPEVWEVFKHDVKIVHFTGLKPWERYEEPDMPVERAIWWEGWEETERERAEPGLESLGGLGRRREQSSS